MTSLMATQRPDWERACFWQGTNWNFLEVEEGKKGGEQRETAQKVHESGKLMKTLLPYCKAQGSLFNLFLATL